MKSIRLLFILICSLSIVHNVLAEELETLYQRAQSLIRRTEGKVFRDTVRPTWLPGNQRFWYRVNIGLDVSEFVLVDASTGTIRRASSLQELDLPEGERLSTSKLQSLKPKRSRRTGEETSWKIKNALADSVEVYWVDTAGERRSYGRVQAGTTKELHTYAGHVWLVSDALGNPLGFFEATVAPMEVEVDGQPVIDEQEKSKPEVPSAKGQSPDGKWTVRIENHNVVLVSSDGENTPLTTDGTEQQPYRGPIRWANDSQHAVVLRVNEVERREVTVVETSPRNQVQPKLMKYDYLKPGDDLPQVRPALIHVNDKKLQVISDELFKNAFTERANLDIRWSPSSTEFYFNYNQRGHQLYRVLAVNATNGLVRIVVEERSQTFIEWSDKTWREWLDDTNELLWMSERDGWAHLWLYDTSAGSVKNQITRGDWVVRQVLKVDAAKRQAWFLAGGVRSQDDPYYRHLCRVNFDGSGFVVLTDGEGDHSIEFSPSMQYFIDRWSRVDQPSVTELRRSEDGQLVCELERADIMRLLESGWTTPERIVSKGRDGSTDIYGILIKPSHFDPSKKYPVVEEVYAGPHGAFTPKTFGRLTRQHMIAELGFIVVQADGMGTDERGKRFQDACWKNLEDAGFPDRIAWIKAVAQSRSWMDLTRVGIYGGSAGGQTAMRALIDHHDFYKVAVADCGCHDNRMDKIWWNEQWLGWPVDESYRRSSNVEHAHRMQGKLLLIVGELDNNVDPASTMQVVGALQKAGKAFEFMPIIGAGHGAAETPYGSQRRIDFLIRNLLGETVSNMPR
jgi:dipeptidyl-peptidase 4